MLRGTGFLGPLRGRWSSRSSPREPKPSFRTSPVRLVANVAVAGLVLANMILAYRLLSEDRPDRRRARKGRTERRGKHRIGTAS